MTPAERAAVHAIAGAFGRLSLAAELVVQTPPGRARAALVDRMEAARKLALAEFSAAQNVLAAEREPPPEMSSAPPKALPLPPAAPPSTPPRAAQTPSIGTTPRLPADAGGGSAVPARAPKPGTIAAIALELAAKGPFTVLELAAATKRDVTVCTSTCGQMKGRGQLAYNPVPTSERMRGVRGTYSLPGAPAFVPRPSTAAPPTDEQLARVGARRLAPEQAAPSAARAPVTGVHRSVADFFADKPALPSNRPPVLPEYGGGRRA